MKVIFRVIGKLDDVEHVLLTTAYYAEAESFCWSYEGDLPELRIERVWVRK